jgi:hypothetical protein
MPLNMTASSMLAQYLPTCMHGTDLYSLASIGDEEFHDLCFEYGIELDDVVGLSLSLLLARWLVKGQVIPSG